MFQLEEQLREMEENGNWYPSRALLRTYEPEAEQYEDPEVMSVAGGFEFCRTPPPRASSARP